MPKIVEYVVNLKKDGHRYAIKYRAGDERYAAVALMSYATDSRFNLAVPEAVQAICEIYVRKAVKKMIRKRKKK